jgi:hypothetical protein
MRIERMKIRPIPIAGDGKVLGPVVSFVVGVKREQPKRANQ